LDCSIYSDHMKMADANVAAVVRRNRPGTKAEVSKHAFTVQNARYG